MASRRNAPASERLEAVLIPGVFGSGKSSVAEEIAEVLENEGLPYALVDLDYLVWFDKDGER